MELVTHPETEFEYWAVIESLGSYIHSTTRGLNRGHIPDPDGEVRANIDSARGLSVQLAQELDEKFGVTIKDHPRLGIDGNYPNPPDGKRWYWPWYHQMRLEWLQSEFDKIICSACPLSEGAEHYSSRVPCTVFPGSINSLRLPHLCAMLDGDWTPSQLLAAICDKGGEDAVAKFLAKRAELTQHLETPASV